MSKNMLNAQKEGVDALDYDFNKMQDRWKHLANPKGYFIGDKVRITDEFEMGVLFDSENIGVLYGVSTPYKNQQLMFHIATLNGAFVVLSENQFEKIENE